ncbi:hypothetical protein GCM10017581_099130 [Dactylosporangium matsuzakiense]|uniref:Uncharacterized protein n=1 Tax=Dactylosporangium matsuzakiense TaxID=53360 RepID=A0A9W6KUZ8_9ACTN|nr:hypothetical protein GCM10017581_099130 [Dactylosporangium matsuzakiense]
MSPKCQTWRLVTNSRRVGAALYPVQSGNVAAQGRPECAAFEGGDVHSGFDTGAAQGEGPDHSSQGTQHRNVPAPGPVTSGAS